MPETVEVVVLPVGMRAGSESFASRIAYWERIAAEEEARLTAEYPRLSRLQVQRIHEAADHNAKLARGRARAERRAWVDAVLAEVAEYHTAQAAAGTRSLPRFAELDNAHAVLRDAIRRHQQMAEAVAEVNAYVQSKI